MFILGSKDFLQFGHLYHFHSAINKTITIIIPMYLTLSKTISNEDTASNARIITLIFFNDLLKSIIFFICFSSSRNIFAFYFIYSTFLSIQQLLPLISCMKCSFFILSYDFIIILSMIKSKNGENYIFSLIIIQSTLYYPPLFLYIIYKSAKALL